LHLLVHFPL